MQGKANIELAAQAHTEICLIGAVIKILEGGDIRNHKTQGAAAKCIRLLTTEQTRLVRDYDRLIAKDAAHD